MIETECIAEESIPDLIRFFVTGLAVFFIGHLPLDVDARFYEQRMNKVLLKYYSKDEITIQNIHRIDGREAINLSNGVTLPHEDLVYVNNGTAFDHLFVILLTLFLLLGLDYVCGGKNIRFVCWMLNKKIPRNARLRWVRHSIYKEYLAAHSCSKELSSDSHNEIGVEN